MAVGVGILEGETGPDEGAGQGAKGMKLKL